MPYCTETVTALHCDYSQKYVSSYDNKSWSREEPLQIPRCPPTVGSLGKEPVNALQALALLQHARAWFGKSTAPARGFHPFRNVRPSFRDGVIASAVDDATEEHDVLYFSSAGNSGLGHRFLAVSSRCEVYGTLVVLGFEYIT